MASPGTPDEAVGGVLKPSEVLAKAADLIAPEGRWTQGWWALDPTGLAVYPSHIGAVCWCARGAIVRAAGGMVAAEPAEKVFSESYLSGPIARVNDAPERTQAEVVTALRNASELAKAEDQ